jgi:TPR repeat protein
MRPAVSRLILFLLLSMAVVPAARADAFAAGLRAYAAQNYVRAARIFLPLAEERDARAQTYLGVMYLRGKGVPQNFAVAAYWLHLASAAGVPTAQYFFGLMNDKGQGMAQDFVLAQAWLNLAVAHAEPRLRSRWVLIRDAVASKMTEDQLAEARELAYEWRAEPYLALDWRLDSVR